MQNIRIQIMGKVEFRKKIHKLHCRHNNSKCTLHDEYLNDTMLLPSNHLSTRCKGQMNIY